MLIDLFSSDLLAGADEKWRFELLRACTRKWDRYTQQEARKERYERALPFIGLALLPVCGAGAWLTFRNVERKNPCRQDIFSNRKRTASSASASPPTADRSS